MKFGVIFHNDQVNENPNATFNGTFIVARSRNRLALAEVLLGIPGNFSRNETGQRFYLRNQYEGAFFQDSWRATSNLTVNVGLRRDDPRPWNEKYDNIQTIVPAQSVLYPNAPPGLLVAGDPGIPKGLSPTQDHNFAPRIGLAYSPNAQNRFLKFLLGDAGKSSIRASFGMFYTEFRD